MLRYSFVLVVMLVAVGANENYFRVLDSIQQEQPCSQQGGICTIAADCPEGHLLQEKGLCPTQKRMGVECCYGLSVKETRCSKRGGSCFDEKTNPCNQILRIDATDCPKETVCCILVQ